MDNKVEVMIEQYKGLKQTEGMSPAERCLVSKQKKDLWWDIRQETKHFSNAIRMRVFRAAHPEKAFEQFIYQRDRRRVLKKELLTHYGNGKCACVRCGESRLACLSIDHIEGRGSHLRKGALRGSGAFYNWLKKQGYPKGYQTLCMNCQFIKRFENNEEGKYATQPIDWQVK
ncbi:hypothetical protein LCGC14_0988660 [marine sediment metagenome]|uniref:Uncharacterized protein n=1 Tax=marine sediment metagenome TaxID=412755 RepID=A0A0F9NT46_9ZZZZ